MEKLQSKLLATLLRQEAPSSVRFIVALTFMSGAANAALVALINSGAATVYSKQQATWEFFVFLACLALFLYTKKVSELGGKAIFENAMTRQRLRIMDKLLKTEVSAIEKMRQSEIITKSTRNIGQILQASDTIVYGLQSMFMLLFCSVYLFQISPLAFLAVVVGMALVALLRLSRNEENRASLGALIQRESDLSAMVAEAIDGFKEIKVNARRRAALHRAHDGLVTELAEMSEVPTKRFVTSRVLIQGMFYLILAVIVFVIPRFTEIYTFEVMKITAVVLFIVGYLAGFLDIIPVIQRTNAALESLASLELELDAGAENEAVAKAAEPEPVAFKSLRVDGLSHAYHNPDGTSGFAIGPISLKLDRGDIMFVIGGNGSGKSTLIKLITGIYSEGVNFLRLNGKPLDVESLPLLRAKYAVILSDFHLFEHFYGYEDVQPEIVNDLIRKMQLETKVSFANGSFSTKALSTGQRKRLALIAAIIEDRDIYVFDEWAADQDPVFRRYFYEELLGELQAAGKTVIAVTHDEHYLHCANKILRLEYGRIVKL